LAVASLGATNDYDHPHAQTLALLERRGIPLLRTDLEGTIDIASDGKTWEVVGRQPLVRGPPGRSERVVREKAEHGGGAKPPARLIEVNKASLEELESLPGVGPTIAKRIVEGRPYGSVDDLRRVKGIGEKRLEEMRPFVRAK
jgi:competence ComEA-like helix-hairpin-helix protein